MARGCGSAGPGHGLGGPGRLADRLADPWLHAALVESALAEAGLAGPWPALSDRSGPPVSDAGMGALRVGSIAGVL